MKNKNVYFVWLLLCSIWSLGAQAAAPVPVDPMPNSMADMEKELASFQKELESLSPEEQASFFKAMEEAVQKIDELSKTDEGKALLEKLDKGEISEEELDQLINQVVGEEAEEPEKEAKDIAEIVEEAPKKIPSKPAPVFTSKHEQMITAIDEIMAHSAAFLIKSATLPELPNKIKKWEKQKLIEVKSDLTWNQLKSDIETFISNLSKLLEKNQKTKEYYHLNNVLKSEPLVNNLKKIHYVLSQVEPQIEEISLFGTPGNKRRTSKTTKQAFQKMINQYNEALYKLNIIEEIKKILALFEPQAKTLREEEDSAFQKAETERKKKIGPGEPITIGSSEDDYIPYYPSTARLPRAGMSPRPMDETFGNQPKGTATAFPKKTTDDKLRKAKTKKDKDKSSTVENKGTKGNDALENLKKRAAKIDEKIVKEADFLIEKITENIKHTSEIIKQTDFFTHLAKNSTDESDVNFEVVTDIIPELLRELSIRRGALGNIDQLQRKLQTISARNKYQDKLKKVFEQYKNPLENVYSQLDSIEKKFSELESSIPQYKLHAYFGKEISSDSSEINKNTIEQQLQKIEKTANSVEDGLEKAVAYLQQQEQPIDTKLVEVQQKIPSPISLFELKKNIGLLRNAIYTFNQGKLIK